MSKRSPRSKCSQSRYKSTALVPKTLVDKRCRLGLQTLHGMLEREIWKQLPIIPGGLPSIRLALDDPSVLAAFPFNTSSFGEWVANGNPWHMQAYGMAQPLCIGVAWCHKV